MVDPAWRDRVERDLADLFPNSGRHLGPQPSPPGVVRYRGRGGAPEPVPGAGPTAPEASRSRSRSSRREPERPIYAIGDVHGRYDLLRQLLGRIVQDHRQTGDGEPPLLVFLGDYVDRGPDSALVVEALVWLRQHSPWPMVLLKGNHEQALLDFLTDPAGAGPWLQFGGLETLAAYGVEPPHADHAAGLARACSDLLAAMPASHLHLLQGLDLLAQAGDYVFVHAGLAPGIPLAKQREADLLWIREPFLEAARPSNGVVVHGHTWIGERPVLLEQRIGVDTGAFFTGVLTAVRLDGQTRRVLQARDGAARPAQGDLVRRPADFTQGQVRLNLGLRGGEGPPAPAPSAASL